MKNFNDFFEWLMKWEGETFEDDHKDPGGATKFGIDQRSHLNLDIKDLTRDQAKDIYLKQYQSSPALWMWNPLCWIFFDTEINCGKTTASKILQGSLNVEIDGIIGANTKRAIMSFSGDKVILKNYLSGREKFYKNLAFTRPSMGRYLDGWLNRVNDLSSLTLCEDPENEKS